MCCAAITLQLLKPSFGWNKTAKFDETFIRVDLADNYREQRREARDKTRRGEPGKKKPVPSPLQTQKLNLY